MNRTLKTGSGFIDILERLRPKIQSLAASSLWSLLQTGSLLKNNLASFNPIFLTFVPRILSNVHSAQVNWSKKASANSTMYIRNFYVI